MSDSSLKICHIVKVHFDRRSPKATQDWLNDRYEFFRKWTLHSLKEQTLKDLYLWVHCDPGMETMVGDLRGYVPKDTVFTFNSYGASCVNETRSDRGLGKALQSCDYVYVTRIDSDDIYANTALSYVNSLRPQRAGNVEVEAAIFRRGYAYDVRSKRLGVYHNQSSPFHTLLFPKKVFCHPVLYRDLFVGDHSMVNGRYHVQSLPDWQFTVLIHGNNFLSTFDYSRQREEPVERGWAPDRFIAQPIVFDVDDFCDEWDCLSDLLQIKEAYPGFRCTLFSIPSKCSKALLTQAKSYDWIELAVHGINHVPGELLHTSANDLKSYFRSLDYDVFTEGFRPPYWEISSDVIDACNDAGLWVALHERDKTRVGPSCLSGYYACGDRLPYSHHHSHDVCGNWVRSDLPTLLTKWPRSQAFSFVSDSVLVPQR